MKKSIIFLLAVVTFSFHFTACTENENVLPTSEIDTQLTEDESFAASTFASIDYQAEITLANNPNGRETATSEEVDRCATLTWNSEERTVIVDFGEENCECADGKNRRGQIIISFTGRFIEQNKTTMITLKDFFVNDNQVEGTRTIKNLGANEEGYLQQEITLVGGRITLTNGTTISRDASWTRTWIRAQNWLDDQYVLEGNASGITRRGVAYSTEIVTPLIRKKACRAERIFIPVAGVKEITASFEGEERVRSIDFGEGNCDKMVTITVNGETQEKELNQRPS